MQDRLENALARVLKHRAESVPVRELTSHQVERRARRLLLERHLIGVLVLLALLGFIWWRLMR